MHKVKSFSKKEIQLKLNNSNSFKSFFESLGYSRKYGSLDMKTCENYLSELGIDFSFKRNNTSKGCVDDKYLYAFKNAYSKYAKRALDSNSCFEFSFDEFIEFTQNNCFYCGEKPVEKNFKQYTSCFHGIDRVDSSVGYLKSNCVPCCKMCNQMKSNYHVDDFKLHIKKLYDNLFPEGVSND